MVRFFFVLPVDPYPDAFGEKKLIHRKDGSCVIRQAIEITYNGTVTKKIQGFHNQSNIAICISRSLKICGEKIY
jgi:hypothetical protein